MKSSNKKTTGKAMVAKVVLGVLIALIAQGGTHVAGRIADYYVSGIVNRTVYECLFEGQTQAEDTDPENRENDEMEDLRNEINHQIDLNDNEK